MEYIGEYFPSKTLQIIWLMIESCTMYKFKSCLHLQDSGVFFRWYKLANHIYSLVSDKLHKYFRKKLIIDFSRINNLDTLNEPDSVDDAKFFVFVWNRKKGKISIILWPFIYQVLQRKFVTKISFLFSNRDSCMFR